MSDKKVLYPDLKAGQTPDGHPTTLVTFVEGEPPIEVCGHSWCRGECGLPAAVIVGPPELKLYGCMTACAAVMQHWRVIWTGKKIEIPEEHHEALMKRIWF